MPPRKLVIDTDGAADDIRAISLALQQPDIDVLAITTVQGVVSVQQAVANVSRALRANQAHVPIYKGAHGPLVKAVSEQNLEWFFGKDGTGDQPEKLPKVLPKDFENFESNMTAASALIDIMRRHDDVTLVCIGPLTNIALALNLDPKFAKRPKEMVIMGGNVYGVGNIDAKHTAEFNFGADPEAAYVVLERMRCPLTIVPWEATCFEIDDMEGKETDINNHLQLGTPLADYLSSVTSVCRRHYAKSNKQLGFVDEVAVAYALSSDKIVKKHRMLRASVELSGEYTRGQVACAWSNKSTEDERPLVKFIISYRVELLEEMLRAAVKNSK
uniref:Inosine-uridine preferring nucleoside hydrolase n=1 Tax=Ascaris suum TaxID=6253 RepID=F1L475_ASCSU